MPLGSPRPTSVDIRFVDPDAGFAAAAECRAAGFRTDISADGGILLTVRASTDRLDELAAIIETHGGEQLAAREHSGAETGAP